MSERLTIGEVSRRTGVPSRTIRFYEAQGVIRAPQRSDSGYRLYTTVDVRRLRLAKRARLLGLPLPEVRALLEQAFLSECSDFAELILARIQAQRVEIDRRIAELEALGSQLEELERHVQHSRPQLTPGQRVSDCGFCPLIDEEGGEEG